MNGDAGLIVRGRGEGFLLAGWNGGVALNQLGHDAAKRFHAQRKRSDIKQQNILHIALQHGALNCGANGNHFIRVDAAIKLLRLENILGNVLYFWNANGSTNHDHFLDVLGGQLGVTQRLLAWTTQTIEQILAHVLKTRARHGDLQMARATLIRRDKRQIHHGFKLIGQLNLGFFRGFLQALQSHGVLADINAFLLAEFFGNEIDQALIKVVATKMAIAVGAHDFKHAVTNIQNADVECSAAQIKHGNAAVLFLFQTIRQCRGGWLIDDALHLKTSDFAGVLGGLALTVVEICRHSNDRAIHFLAQIILGHFFQLLQNHGANFWRCVFLAANFHLDQILRATGDRVRHHLLFAFNFAMTATHEALDAEHGVLWIGHLLMARRLANQSLALFSKSDNAWGCAAA